MSLVSKIYEYNVQNLASQIYKGTITDGSRIGKNEKGSYFYVCQYLDYTS
jgi:hypothetical protein